MLQVHTSVVVESVFKHTFLIFFVSFFFTCVFLRVLLLTKSVFFLYQFIEHFKSF